VGGRVSGWVVLCVSCAHTLRFGYIDSFAFLHVCICVHVHVYMSICVYVCT